MDFSTKVAIFLVQFSAIIIAIAIFFYRNRQTFYSSFIEKLFIFIAGSTMLGGVIISFMNDTLDAILMAYLLLFVYRTVTCLYIGRTSKHSNNN